jgi:ribosomal protein L44E
MKIPRTAKKYCKQCKKATEHKVEIYKSTGKRGTLSRGSISRSKYRGLGRGFGNLGKWGSKPAVTKFKRAGVKSSKKTTIQYMCNVCKKKIQQSHGIRAKKVEFNEETSKKSKK